MLKNDSVPPIKFTGKLDYIDVDKIVANLSNPREPISKEEITDIKESIHMLGGVLVPIVVYQEGDHFVLLDGERRWRACKELAKVNPNYKKVPANIIEKPLTEIQNIQTMFNIHQKRKEWSTSAKAVAVGKLQSLRKRQLSVQEICKLTGLKEVAVTDALLLLRFPQDVRDRCLNGDLDEFYPILLGRNLRSLEKTFPDIFKKYSWDDIAKTFMYKVDKDYIQRARDFNKIGRMAKTCIFYDSEPLFHETFDKMMYEGKFTPKDGLKEIDKKLGYKLEVTFRNNSNEFFESLSSYLKGKPSVDDLPLETLEILRKIYERLRKAILQRTIA